MCGKCGQECKCGSDMQNKCAGKCDCNKGNDCACKPEACDCGKPKEACKCTCKEK